MNTYRIDFYKDATGDFLIKRIYKEALNEETAREWALNNAPQEAPFWEIMKCT